MNKEASHNNPLQLLGQKIRSKRLDLKQSISEVSGSIEVDEKELLKIEVGLKKPSQEVLELLIEHFKISELEASSLFELAGYGMEKLLPTNLMELLQGMAPKTFIMLSPIEQKIVSSDTLDVHIDKDNIVFDFKQNLGNNQPITVSRVAMNVNNAYQVLDLLSKALIKQQYLKGSKELPSRLDQKEATTT